MESLSELGKSRGQDLGKFGGKGNPGGRILTNLWAKENLGAGNFKLPEINPLEGCFCSLWTVFCTLWAVICPLIAVFFTLWVNFSTVGRFLHCGGRFFAFWVQDFTL